MRAEKRREEREVPAFLPVTLANASGIIRGVSGTGIYFETEAEYMIGNKVDLTVELNTPTGRLPIQMPG